METHSHPVGTAPRTAASPWLPVVVHRTIRIFHRTQLRFALRHQRADHVGAKVWIAQLRADNGEVCIRIVANAHGHLPFGQYWSSAGPDRRAFICLKTQRSQRIAQPIRSPTRPTAQVDRLSGTAHRAVSSVSDAASSSATHGGRQRFDTRTSDCYRRRRARYRLFSRASQAVVNTNPPTDVTSTDTRSLEFRCGR